MDRKKLGMHRFEVSRAMRHAHQLTSGELMDPHQAIHDLARAVATLALALDQLLEAAEAEDLAQTR